MPSSRFPCLLPASGGFRFGFALLVEDELLPQEDDGQTCKARQVGHEAGVDQQERAHARQHSHGDVQAAHEVSFRRGGDEHHAGAGGDDHLETGEERHVL